MTPRRRRPRHPAPDPAPGDRVIELPGPSTAQLVARQFSYPQLRAFVATNPPGSANERATFDAIHLLIRDPDLYRGSQIDQIAAAMSPLEIVADRRVLPPGPLADTLTAALAQHHQRERADHNHGHDHDMPDPPPPGVQATVTTLRPSPGGPAAPAGRAATTPDLSPPEVEPEYLASLIAETEARIAAGETDLIGEPDPTDDLDPDPDPDVEDYPSLATDHDHDHDEVTREQGNELDYACCAAALDRDDLDRDDLERARMSLAEVRDGLADWDRRRAAHEQPSRDTAPARPPTSRLDPAALEADRARRDVAEQEAQRHADTERRTDLAAEYDAEPHVP